MVGSGSQPPTTETSGSVDESTLQNPIQINLTGLYRKHTNYRKYEEFPIIYC